MGWLGWAGLGWAGLGWAWLGWAGTIVWSKETGAPIYPAIIWQDRRTSDLCNALKRDGHEAMVKEKTGLVIDSYFSATKLKWILDNVPNAREQAVSGKLLFGTVDSFLIYNLTSERNHLTDVTNASRTMLFNIHEMSWDKELLKLFDIPLSMMPEVKSCDGDFGSFSIDGKTIQINGVIGDQHPAPKGLHPPCEISHGHLSRTQGITSTV